jgi:hypothetical protein
MRGNPRLKTSGTSQAKIKENNNYLSLRCRYDLEAQPAQDGGVLRAVNIVGSRA